MTCFDGAMSFLCVGDLARLGGISIRMLGLDHEIGLLISDPVDADSGCCLSRTDQIAIESTGGTK